MRVLGYCRVSTQDQTNDTQEDQIRTWARSRKIEDLEIFQDVISGSKDTRPALDQMMGRIRRGGVDLVVTAYLSRLGRSQSHLIQILEELRNREVRYIALNDGIDTGTPTGRLLYGILSALAEHEREQIRERTALRIARLKAQGKRLGRKPKWDDPGRKTRILNLVREDPEITIRRISEITGWSETGISRLIRRDPELSGIWRGIGNNQHRRD